MITKNCYIGVFKAFLIGMLFHWFPLGAEDDQALLNEISANYRRMTPCVLSFEIIQYYDANSEDYQSSEGSFHIGSANSFRVDFVDQEIIFDGKWLWSFDKQNGQVIIEQIDPQSSLKFIFDMLFGNWINFKVLSEDELSNPNMKILSLDTVDDNAYFNSIKLEVNVQTREFRSATYLDFNNVKTIIRFTSPRKLNPKVAEILFDTERMEAKELIDLRP